jgi:hypothetical protein
MQVMLLPHPMIGRTSEDIEKLVDQVFDRVVQALTGGALAEGAVR